MRFRGCIFGCLCMLSLGVWANGGQDERLKGLDRIVKYPEKYGQVKYGRISALRAEREVALTDEARLKADRKLAQEYKVYIADSALYYIREQLEIAAKTGNPEGKEVAKMEMAEILIITGMYKEAEEILGSLNPEKLLPGRRGYYFQLYHTLYRALRDYAVGKQARDRYERQADRYRDSLLAVYPPGSDTHIRVRAEQLISRGDYQEALDLLLPYYATLDPESREMGYTAYSVAEAYRHLGDKEKEKEYLTVSALADLKSGVKEYISLRELAVLLYAEGDISRAYAYMKRAMEDAAFCNARLRTVEVSQVLPIINEAYRVQTEKRRRQMWVSLLCISVLAVVLVGLLLYVRKQMKRLSAAKREVGQAYDRLQLLNGELKALNERLSDSNARLQEVNVALLQTNNKLEEVNYIKEAYIGRFLDLCSTYIGKLESYRRSLNKMALNGRTEELFRELKSTQFVDEELEEFYRNFDSAFLRLFPDFVMDFNALLADGEEIILKPGELLNTELRIFALIRLGITDSNKIAQFLRYSLKTIYNYRTKMRNKARGVRDDFEQEVMRIGTF